MMIHVPGRMLVTWLSPRRFADAAPGQCWAIGGSLERGSAYGRLLGLEVSIVLRHRRGT